MSYIIASQDESKFITTDDRGKFTWTSNKETCMRFTESKAVNVINCCLAKPASNYKIVKITETLKENAQTAIDSIEKRSCNRVLECDWGKELQFDVASVAINFASIVNDLNNEKVKLNNILIILSRAMVDLYHYKEQHTRLSAINICRLYKFEVAMLVKRRECKDRLFFVDRMLGEVSGKDESEEIEKFMEANHTYRVRILDELFDGEIKDFDEWFEGVIDEYKNETKQSE